MRRGHDWIFSNEVDVAATPLVGLEAGEHVNVLDQRGKVVGTAMVNPSSLICARMVSRRADRPMDRVMLARRLADALRLRERLGFGRCYRLVHGESDGLPGLAVDRHGDVVVVQITTAGMQRLQEDVIAALVEVLGPQALVLRNDTPARALEGLSSEVLWAHGEQRSHCEIEENGARFRIEPASGQKTGWFYDQRLNRARVASYARGARVLDLFCYLGGFGVQAARAGATEVLCVDASAAALAGVETNARLNDVDRRVRCLRADAFEALKGLAEEGERFDMVVTDPPAFARRRRDRKAALEAYRRLNRLAMRVLGSDGVLAAASCSSHVDRPSFLDALRQAASSAPRRLMVLEVGGQAPDHPLQPAMPETDYLKSYITLARG